MDATEARHRRAWRLAYLLNGGDARRAAAVALGAARTARGGGVEADTALLDRRVLQLSRERGAAGGGVPAAGSAGADAAVGGSVGGAVGGLRAASAMPRQCLEAWVLARVDELEEIHVARAMDCSRTATARHLARAEELMAEFAGGSAVAAAAVRAAMDGLDPGPALRAEATRRRRLARVRWSVVLLACAGAALLAARAGGLW